MRSPFKFLDAYTLHYRDVFFGREEEVSQLYRMVSQNRLVLVYGQSGTGKTSLIQCGLAARFEATDWYALSIRRGEDINRSCERFHIRLEDPRANIQQIIDKISAGKSGIQLPYLQVYLDMLYREDFARTYPDLATVETLPDPLPPLEFTSEEIEAFGQIEDVLAKFLKDQEKQLQQDLEEKFENIPEDGVRQVLDAFVSEEGTKRPLRYERKEEMIRLEPALRQGFPEWSEAALSYCLQRLEAARLLRAGEDTLELAHDSLARLIDQERSDEQRQLNEVKSRILNAHREFLSRKQLISIEEFLSKISLTEELKQFVSNSQADAQDREQAELARQQQELEKERNLRAEAEKAQETAILAQQKAESSARRARLFSMLAAIVAAVAIFAAGFAVWQNIRTHLATGDNYRQQEYFTDALEEYQAARRLSLFGKEGVNQKINDLDSIRNMVLTYRRYIEVADSLVEAGPTHYLDALVNYAKAELLEYNLKEPRLKSDNLMKAIDRQFEIYKEKGRAFREADGLEDARYAYEIANKLKPGDEEVERMLRELK